MQSVAPAFRFPQPLIAGAVVSALSCACIIAYAATKVAKPLSRRVIASPRDTLLPRLSLEQQKALPYPPNLVPGARDVTTPYGIMRVYEWGPEHGKKVILVHGDATPAPLLLPLANGLVQRGCRIMLFDLWGRGYSDTPADSQHDSRLYSLQLLFAASSSPIAWTGEASSGFSIVGFSMGGSIALDFFAHFPLLVNSLVLLGPGGLLRQLPLDYRNFWYWHPSAVPKAYVRGLIGKLLGVEFGNDTRNERWLKTEKLEATAEVEPGAILQFQFDHHAGHAESFLSTIQYGPLQKQHEIWQHACRIISGQDKTAAGSRLSGGKVLVVCGEQDDVVPADDVKQDLVQLLGPQHFTFATVPGGHGFPLPQADAIVQHIADFWDL